MVARTKDTREPKPCIEYVSVSTKGQGRSGLGLEARREAISRFCTAERFNVVASFVEIESAKGDTLAHRPKLKAALKAARKIKDDDYRCAPIVVAKLDRLSRDVFHQRPDDGARSLHLRFGSSIVMTVAEGPTVFGVPLLTSFGLLGYLIAFVNSLWIILSIWRSGRR